VDVPELGGLTLWLHVQDEVDVALPEAQHVLGAMPRDSREAHRLEQRLQRLRLWRGEFDELEAVRAERIVEQVGVGLGVHGGLRRFGGGLDSGDLSNI
jgi:hypothetical protein